MTTEARGRDVSPVVDQIKYAHSTERAVADRQIRVLSGVLFRLASDVLGRFPLVEVGYGSQPHRETPPLPFASGDQTESLQMSEIVTPGVNGAEGKVTGVSIWRVDSAMSQERIMYVLQEGYVLDNLHRRINPENGGVESLNMPREIIEDFDQAFPQEPTS